MKAFFRRFFPWLFYRAPWDLPPAYRFARRVGGILYRERENQRERDVELFELRAHHFRKYLYELAAEDARILRTLRAERAAPEEQKP